MGAWLADYPAMSFFSVCWHSRKWWTPICGGTLQSALSRLEKVQWTKFFCNNGISHTNCPWKGKKHDKKSAKSLQKRWGFQNFWNEGSLQIGIPKWRDPSKSEFRNGGIPPNQNSEMEGSLKQMANRWRCLQLCQKWLIVQYFTYAANIKILLCNLEFVNP